MHPFLLFLLFVLCLLLAGCESTELSTVTIVTEVPATPEPTAYVTPEPTELPMKALQQIYRNAEENSKAKIVFSQDSGFYQEDISVSITAEGAEYIFYTLDGAVPSYRSLKYTRPIALSATHADLPKCIAIRAVAYYSDGTKSPVFTHTYFMDTEIDARFSTLVFSIVGDPEELTSGPNAIFVGDNAKLRGGDTEREVYLEIFTEEGKNVAAQTVGVRVYGAVSRSLPLKSMKIYARKSYDPKHKTIAYNFFNTPRVRGGSIKEYKKLVLRNTANDFQRAFIRDEFVQYVARKAGFPDSEGVRPVVIYLNGQYYALYWLHESYCDDYFKARYGDTEGEYVILEGSEKQKQHTSEKDSDYDPAAAEFQRAYERLSSLDLTDDENYAEVCAFMDVENYLKYYALNVYIGNVDWPNNNEKLFAYFPDDGKYDEEGVRDGRWRWLPHDMDMTLYLYGDSEEHPAYPSFNNLKAIVSDVSNIQYSPLFSKLMERMDCRTSFIIKMYELYENVFKPDVMLTLLDEADQMRARELEYFFVRLDELRQDRNIKIWTTYSRMPEEMERLRTYILQRPAYVRQYIKSELVYPYAPLPEKNLPVTKDIAREVALSPENGLLPFGD